MSVKMGRLKRMLWLGAIVTAAGAGAVGVPGPAAQAQGAEIQYRRPQPYDVQLPPPEAKGCYFYRGRRYCGAYCYWEVNGKRYCQRRERDAHSQAPIVVDEGYSAVLK